MMKETNIHSQVTSTIAGDDGEAVAKSEQNAKKKVLEKPNEGLEKPADAGWYVAVVRVNPQKAFPKTVTAGNYSGIAHLHDDIYAVVSSAGGETTFGKERMIMIIKNFIP